MYPSTSKSSSSLRKENTSMVEQIKNHRRELGDLTKESQDQKQRIIDKATDDFKQASKVNKGLLEAKMEPVLTLPAILLKKTEQARLKNEMIKAGIKEANDQYDVEFNAIMKEHEDKIDALKVQFDDMCVKKRDDVERSAINFERYLNVKNARLDEMRAELTQLYELALRHDIVVQRVESGAYSQGIVSMHIPGKDKQMITLPTEADYPELFKSLTKDKHLRTQTAKMSRAKEVYMKNIKIANDEKMKLASAAKDETKITLAETVKKVDPNTASASTMITFITEQLAIAQALQKEELQLLSKLTTIEHMRKDTQFPDIMSVEKARDDLRLETQKLLSENRELMKNADRNRKLLEKDRTKLGKEDKSTKIWGI